MLLWAGTGATACDAANDISGLDGPDRPIGGAGNESCTVDSSGDAISATTTLAIEVDAVQGSVSWTLGTNLERLTLTGTAANGAGNPLGNSLTGNAAANTLDGGTGADTLLAGACCWRAWPSASCWRKRPGRAGSTGCASRTGSLDDAQGQEPASP